MFIELIWFIWYNVYIEGDSMDIEVENNKYKLEDVDDVDKAYELLVEKIKG